MVLGLARDAFLRFLLRGEVQARRQAFQTVQPRARLPVDVGPLPEWRVDSRDPTELLRVYVEPDEVGVAVHLVWRDEVVPLAQADERYRAFRREELGRTADVETILVKPDEVVFPGTWGGPQPYWTSIHGTWREPRKGVVFTRTWNHMLSSVPNPRASYERVDPAVRDGGREAAEAYAESL